MFWLMMLRLLLRTFQDGHNPPIGCRHTQRFGRSQRFIMGGGGRCTAVQKYGFLGIRLFRCHGRVENSTHKATETVIRSMIRIIRSCVTTVSCDIRSRRTSSARIRGRRGSRTNRRLRLGGRRRRYHIQHAELLCHLFTCLGQFEIIGNRQRTRNGPFHIASRPNGRFRCRVVSCCPTIVVHPTALLLWLLLLLLLLLLMLLLLLLRRTIVKGIATHLDILLGWSK